jgi:hypothetical protein
MGIVKKLFKEKRLCKVLVNDVELDEWLAVDLNMTHYVVCETTTRWSCWLVPRPLLKTFMNQFHRDVEKVKLWCPS